MPAESTAIYVALMALLFVGLSVRTLRLRLRLGVGVGDGGDARLIKALRAHSNFAEYGPFCLFLIYLLETVAGATIMVHVYGIVLVVGRSVHAYGISQTNENYRYRVIGMACTFIVLIGCSIRLLATVVTS